MNLISELFLSNLPQHTFTVRPNIFMVRNKHVISCYLKTDQKFFTEIIVIRSVDNYICTLNQY